MSASDGPPQEYFGEISRRYRSRILRCCYSVVHDLSLAEDLTQETFKRAFTEIHRFREGNFYAWLYTIARRLCINYLKSRQAREVAAIDEPAFIASKRNFEVELMKADEVLAVLSELPKEQRICLKMLYIEGLSYREISSATGHTEEEVKTHVQNGKRRFKILWERQRKR